METHKSIKFPHESPALLLVALLPLPAGHVRAAGVGPAVVGEAPYPLAAVAPVHVARVAQLLYAHLAEALGGVAKLVLRGRGWKREKLNLIFSPDFF